MTLKYLWSLIKESVSAWIDDYAPSMGAALAYYTVFSMAPLLLIVIAVAGLVFGEAAAQGEIVAQLRDVMGDEGAVAVQGLLKSVSEPSHGIIATVASLVTLVVGATTVFAELQSALDRIWRAPALKEDSGIWNLLRSRLLSFGMVLGLGFLLLISLVVSAALAALGKWWSGIFGGWESLLQVIDFGVSFAFITLIFAMIYKFLPRVYVAWSDVWIGAAVTALLFTIGKFLIGLYLGRSSVTSGFGAAGSLVVLLVWVYYSAQIFLLGAEFTSMYAHRSGSRVADPNPQAVAAVPTRSGDAAVKAQGGMTPVASLSKYSRPPSAAAASTTGHRGAAARATEFIQQHPMKSLGIVVTIGLIWGGILRQIAPPPKSLLRRHLGPK